VPVLSRRRESEEQRAIQVLFVHCGQSGIAVAVGRTRRLQLTEQFNHRLAAVVSAAEELFKDPGSAS